MSIASVSRCLAILLKIKKLYNKNRLNGENGASGANAARNVDMGYAHVSDTVEMLGDDYIFVVYH